MADSVSPKHHRHHHHIRMPALPGPAAKWLRLFAMSVAIGVVAGLATAVIEWGLHDGSELLVQRYANPSGAHMLTFRWELLALPTIGGLLSGLLVRFLCPTATGHGTDVLVRAFHYEGGALPLRGPTVKAAGAVGVIACGGSAGPEGPVAALGAAIGSAVARLFHLTPRERRIMLVAGCGAGIGAIFQCPMGGALFAASIMYKEPDFETEAIVPAFVASVIGYSTYMPFYGFKFPLLAGATGFSFENPMELIPYAVLALVCAGFCGLLFWCLRFVEHRPLKRFRLPRWAAPALGGLATGAVACCVPQVMDGQYVFIRSAMSGAIHHELAEFPASRFVLLFGAVGIAKCLATGFTVGSGAPGGLLGPSVFIGGAAGALVGALVDAIAPTAFSGSLREALIPVGMAGVLAGAFRTPLAAIVMVAEMTDGYGLIVPLMLVCVGSYVVGRRWGLNAEQLGTSADSPAHVGDVVVHLLESWRVSDLMRTDWAETVPPDATLRELVARISPGTHPVFAVIDRRRIIGLVSLHDIQQIVDEASEADVIIAADMMTDDLVTGYPDEDVYEALSRMARDNHSVMPVVTRDTPSTYVGILSRDDVYAAVRKQMEQMRRDLLHEHAGLAAIEHEEQLHQLVMGVSAPQADRIQRLFVPIQAIGRSLRECDFRRQFGVQVIAIELPDGTMQCPPDPDLPLQTNHRLVAIVFQGSAPAPPGKPD